MKNVLLLVLVLLANITIFSQEDYISSTISRNNIYSLKLFCMQDLNTENIALSPFGISNCMAMVYIGSDGKTQQEIAKNINLITPFGVLVSYKNLIKRYQVYKSNDVNLLMGNALWVANHKEIQKKYRNLLKVNFFAHIEDIDLEESDENGIKEINRWVKKSSNFNLLSLLKQEDVELTDELIFTNYLYFDGNWENPFNEQLTSKDDFVLADGSKKKVDFMNQASYLKYNENDIFQIIELPYTGKNMSMIFILPKEDKYMDTLQRIINPINFDFWTSELYTKLVSLSLPKFRIEQSYMIAQFSNDLNLESIFGAKADFSRISKDPIHISRIVQKTIVQVVENKSGDFTELISNADQVNRNKDNTFIKFKACHPFIYIIKDNLNGCILSIGKVNNPNFNDLSADYHN